MELNDFIARTNVYLTDEIFAKVNEEYMASDMDKDTYCEWWIKNRQLAVTRHMAMEVYRQMGKSEEYKQQYSILSSYRDILQEELSQHKLRIRELEAKLAKLKEIVNA